MTLRRALKTLADEGLISAERGRGTFVRSFDLSDSRFSLGQLAGDLLRGNSDVELLSAVTTAANERVAEMLAIPGGTRVIYLRHLVRRDHAPAIYHWEYIRRDPSQPLIELLQHSISLHGLLSAAEGDRHPRGRIVLRASALGPAAARLLGEPAGAPALSVEHLFRDTASQPVSWGCLLLRAGLFALRACLGPEEIDGESRRFDPRH
jgi:GntR family transcriptional regulator